jgi:Uncharacterized conserved protein
MANVPGEYRRSALLGLPYLEHPLPKAIPQLISALIDWMNEQDDEIARLEESGADIRPQVLALAGRVHYLIGIIHPFTDGNGRIARLLTRYLLEKHGYEIAGETREEYDETFGRDFKHNFGIAYGTKRVNIEKAAWPELLAKSNAPAFEGFLTAHVRELSEETQAVYELLEKKKLPGILRRKRESTRTCSWRQSGIYPSAGSSPRRTFRELLPITSLRRFLSIMVRYRPVKLKPACLKKLLWTRTGRA